jgi:glycosyltransferase involved in cell wall biosynthesis
VSGPGVAEGPAPRHVLHVLNGASGGAAKSTVALIEGLRARGIVSSVVCEDGRGGYERDQLVDAVEGRARFMPLWWWNRRIRLPAWKRPLTDARESLRTGRGHWSARAVTDFARVQGADLIHTNTILNPEGARAARRLGIPHVWELRELVGPGDPFRFWFEAWSFRHRVAPACQVLIANSRTTLDRVSSWIPDDLAVVVGELVDVESFAALPIGSSGGEVVVGMVANLTSRWKRQDLFVAAAARVDPALPVRFVLVGHDGDRPERPDPFTEELRRQVDAAGLSSRFELTGFHHDPVEIMRSLDILVHTADKESFGRIAVEAMAAGRPVVGVAGGGIGEVVDDGVTGVLVPPGDAAAVADAVSGLVLDEAARQVFGEAGRRVARERYSLDRMVEESISAYRLAMLRTPQK